jgi:hypothetical protein
MAYLIESISQIRQRFHSSQDRRRFFVVLFLRSSTLPFAVDRDAFVRFRHRVARSLETTMLVAGPAELLGRGGRYQHSRRPRLGRHDVVG